MSDKRQKAYIKSTVTVHDRTQVETVFDYFLYRGKDGPKDEARPSRLSYKVDAYLFYPRQFGIDPQTYPKERFYQDVRPLIRFREPRLTFKQMLGSRPSKRSPLVTLSRYVAELQDGRLAAPLSVAVDEARLFACSFIGNVLRSIDRKRRRFERLAAGELLRKKDGVVVQPEDEAARIVRTTAARIDRIEAVLAEFRRLLTVTGALDGETAKALADEMRAVDEYCHYRVRDALAQVILTLRYAPVRVPEAELRAFQDRVRSALAAHEAYAERAGYLFVSEGAAEDLKERYLHRRGELKRRVWSVLFLSTRNAPVFGVQRQMGAMIAAALAAAWAVTTQIIIIRRYIAHQDPNDLFGLTGLVFLLAGVFAYVVKDRIKEIGRSYFRGSLFGRMPDQKERIYYCDQVVGKLVEHAVFLTPATLPPKVAELRRAAVARAGEGDETVDLVLRYSKDVVLDGRLAVLGRYPLKAVHDILRLNVDAYLSRLGEPRRMVSLIDADGNVRAVSFPKVYYLDMVLDYSRVSAGGRETSKSLEYFRLVLDKTGLLRVERLA